MRTKNKSTWDLRCVKVRLGSAKLADESTVKIEPQLPFLYLPKRFMTEFKAKMNAHFPDQLPCKEGQNYCKFDMICKKVHALGKAGIDFSLDLDDGVNQFSYNLPWTSMFISGYFVNDVFGTCYMPVFDHGLSGVEESNYIYVGNYFME